MLQALAAIPTIINAISKVTDLFHAGQKAKETVTGQPSAASTPEELEAEVNAMPEAVRNQWADIMAKQVEQYAAQNQRLATEIGLIDSNITSKLDTEAANKIAVLRQTTRPWAVRMMVHYIFFPFYLIAIDLVQQLLKSWLFFWTDRIQPFRTFDYVFGNMDPSKLAGLQPGVLDKLLSAFSNGTSHTLAGQMYSQSVPWVVGIIVSYMGLREIGKARGTAGDVPLDGKTPSGQAQPPTVIGTALQTGIDLVSKVRKAFGK